MPLTIASDQICGCDAGAVTRVPIASRSGARRDGEGVTFDIGHSEIRDDRRDPVRDTVLERLAKQGNPACAAARLEQPVALQLQSVAQRFQDVGSSSTRSSVRPAGLTTLFSRPYCARRNRSSVRSPRRPRRCVSC
jgi:hypothetical protein